MDAEQRADVNGGSAGGTVTNGRTDNHTGGNTVVGGAGGGSGAGAGGPGPPASGPVRDRQTISGVDVTHYREMFGFGDGTSGGVHKTAEADVYETPEGVRFIFPRGYDRTSQPITPSQILAAWNQLPDIMKALASYSDEWKMLITDASLNVFSPKCEVLGYCPEKNSCGRKPKKEI